MTTGVDAATGHRRAMDWVNGGGTAVVRPDCELAHIAGTAAQATDLLAATLVHANADGHHRPGRTWRRWPC